MKKRLKTKILLLIVISIFISCDLFTSSNTDLLSKIDADVAWAKADKLTVRLDYHSNWGGSNPQRGNLTPVMDIRKGYEFSVEFTPAPAYSLIEWKAYAYREVELPEGLA